MRILFLYHFPLQASAIGRLTRQWAAALAAEGHEARILTTADHPLTDDPLVIDTLVCSASNPQADVSCQVPHFSSLVAVEGGVPFESLTDAQLAAYRDRLRQRLDAQIDRFDPHVLHVQHLWLSGQLAVETGVPFVANAWQGELLDCPRDPRFRDSGGASGRECQPHPRARRGHRATTGITVRRRRTCGTDERHAASGRIRRSCSTGRRGASAFVQIYQSVLEQRFGR